MRKILAIGLIVTGAAIAAPRAQSSAEGGANAILPWAYVLNEPASGNAEAPDPEEVVTVPDSSVSMPRSAININNGPPD